MSRFSRYLATWSPSQFWIVTVLWIAVVIMGALLTPPGQFLIGTYELLQVVTEVNMEIPVTALRLLAILTPVIAFGPPLVIFPLWRHARREAAATRAA